MGLLPVLYSFRRCPYAMRARMLLYSAKISHEHREVVLKDKPLEMLAISPKGTVPVLQLRDGNVLEESLDIMYWASGISGVKEEEKRLIIENDTTFKHALDRYKYPGRYPEEPGANYQQICEQFLKRLENQIVPFLAGSTAGLIDMAIFPFIRQFSIADAEWFNSQPYPHLKRWLDYFISSPLFQMIMQKYPTWSSKDKPTFVVF